MKAYKEKGKIAFAHKNRGIKHKNAVPDHVKQQIITIYQQFKVRPSIKHFTEILQEEYDISYSDTTIRHILYQEKILSPKSQRKTRKRIQKLIRQEAGNTKQPEQNLLVPLAEDQLELPEKVHPSRPRMKYKGELIQMDASSYNWFGNEVTHLHLAIDDASGNIAGAYFDTQETLKGYYHVLNQILTNQGMPLAFLTDKRTVFEYKKAD